jgi:hypothetical protein
LPEEGDDVRNLLPVLFPANLLKRSQDAPYTTFALSKTTQF